VLKFIHHFKVLFIIYICFIQTIVEAFDLKSAKDRSYLQLA